MNYCVCGYNTHYKALWFEALSPTGFLELDHTKNMPVSNFVYS